jgi:hypothetical protein
MERLINTLISQIKEQVGRTKAKACSQMESVMNHRDHIRKYSVNISEVKEKALNTLVAFGCILRPRLVKQKTIVCLLTEVNTPLTSGLSKIRCILMWTEWGNLSSSK